jgi:hypothetical protein
MVARTEYPEFPYQQTCERCGETYSVTGNRQDGFHICKKKKSLNLTKEFFERIGFNISELPYTYKEIKVWENRIMDGSGRFDGYIVERPVIFGCKTEDDFLQIPDVKLMNKIK